jgi:hypothetical protein
MQSRGHHAPSKSKHHTQWKTRRPLRRQVSEKNFPKIFRVANCVSANKSWQKDGDPWVEYPLYNNISAHKPTVLLPENLRAHLQLSV